MMKKVFFAIALLMPVMFLQAQRKHSHKNSPVAFGLKGGLNISSVHVENQTNSNVDAKASFYLGGLAHIHVTKFFAVQPEIVYSQQGYQNESGNVKYHTRLNYINIPVLAQFMVADGLRLETGPQLGLMVSAHQKAEGINIDTKDNYKSADFAWVVGLGYVTHSGFGVDARYNLGVTNINDVSATKVNNRVFQLGVFYQFSTR